MSEEVLESLRREFSGPELADYVLALLLLAGGRLSKKKVHAGVYILAKRMPELCEKLDTC